MSGRPPVPQSKREAATSMQRGGSSQRQIAAALGVSPAWVAGFQADQASEAAAAVAEAPAAAERPAQPSELAVGPPPTDAETVEGEIGRLSADLARLRALVAGGKLNPGEAIRATDTIGRISARLAVLRKEQRSVTAPDRDATIARAGHAAADKLRRLLEEAIAEAPTMVEDTGEGRS